MSTDRASTQARNARGVVPFQPYDPVLKSPYAHGTLVFAALRSDLDRPGLEAWLGKVDGLIQTLRASTDEDGARRATVAVGFGPTLFVNPTTALPRFGDIQPPAGFARLPSVPQGAPVSADVVFYLVATAEAEIARFIRGLADGHDVVSLALESGYKSRPDRDAFGYADGLRNARDTRNDVVFVDADRNPDEPAWAVRGTYLAYMCIRQNASSFDALSPEEQDRIVGRDRAGRRLDLQAGTDVRTEAGFTGDVPPVCSHVRKAGPRGGPHQDAAQIFRRGMPFYEVDANGQFGEGLQFVSFQASLDQFDVILNRWMFNSDFPTTGAGVDSLFGQGHASIERWGFYFVPPDIDGPIGTGMLKAPPVARPTKTGRVAVRKRVVDSNGNPSRGELGGFTFQVTKLDGTPVGAPFTTDSVGHAISEEIPAGDYQLVEVTVPPPLGAAAPTPFTLKNGQELVHVTNTAPAGANGY
ncbi:hypothetical protein GCM10009798_33480 [Nocardioides panacihumi]|uniref:Dyp-type peroxidase n=2 Tax=Nocardioides panacihumi TaxID=400774 RepID=A0ABN2RJ80_9ACTN